MPSHLHQQIRREHDVLWREEIVHQGVYVGIRTDYVQGNIINRRNAMMSRPGRQKDTFSSIKLPHPIADRNEAFPPSSFHEDVELIYAFRVIRRKL